MSSCRCATPTPDGDTPPSTTTGTPLVFCFCLLTSLKQRYLGGGNREHVRAFASYNGQAPKDFNDAPGVPDTPRVAISAGDILENHARYDYRGFMWKGENERTKAIGLYPGWIVEQIPGADVFPDYYSEQFKKARAQ